MAGPRRPPQGTAAPSFMLAQCVAYSYSLMGCVGDSSPGQTPWIQGPALPILAVWLWVSQVVWVLASGSGAGVHPSPPPG